MRIIVGLGNLGEKYKLTRHNIGFMAVDALAEKLGLAWEKNKKLNAEIAKSPLEMVPWPADRAAIETGDFISDGRTALEGLGWQAHTGFDEGLERTFAFYREHLKQYL